MIKVKDVWKAYGSLEVLKGLNLEVFKGETLVILGRSGVGKSVLLKLIMGLETADQGIVTIDGENLAELKPAERFKKTKTMGMLFQGAALFDSMNIEDNIAFYLKQHQKKLKDKEIKEKVAESLEKVGLKDVEKKLPANLSGGMRKRAALARLIIYRPDLFLYDEPTTGLDPITARHIGDLILQIQQDFHPTSVVVTHDMGLALLIGDRLAFHHDGKITHIGTKQEFLKIEDPELQAFFDNSILKPEQLGAKNI